MSKFSLKIGDKDYPFLVSAASAKRNAQIAIELNGKQSDEVSIDSLIDQYTDILHMGLRDGKLTLPFWKRLFHFIPSKKRLQRLVEFDDMVKLIGAASNPPPALNDDQNKDDEKK